MSADSGEEEFAFEEAQRFVEAQRQGWQPVKIRRALIGSWLEKDVPLVEQIERSAADGLLEHVRIDTAGGVIGKSEVEALVRVDSLRKLEIDDYGGRIDPAVISSLFEGLATKSGFRELTLAAKWLGPGSIDPFAGGQLSSLRLRGLKGKRIDADWFEALAKLERLETLSIWSQADELCIEEFSRLENLLRLDCTCSAGIGREGMVSVAGIANLSRLQSLRIVGTPKLWILDPEHFAEAPALCELGLSVAMPEHKEIEFLADCPRLQKLSLPDLSHLGSGGLEVIGQLGELRSLSVSGTVHGDYLERFRGLKQLEEFFLGVGRVAKYGDLDFPDATQFAALLELEQLRNLKMNSWRVTDEHFGSLAGHPALEAITFTRDGRCKNALGDGLVECVDRSPALTTLNIGGASIGDECLVALADVARNLRRVDLFDSPPLSLHALNAFRRKNPQCELMSDPTSYCALDADAVFDYGQPQKLEFDQDEIDDLVARGAAAMTRMVSFDPMDGRLTDLGCSYLRASESLRGVSLRSCPEVTARGLEFLGECPSLEGVTLAAQGSQISDAEVSAFQQRFPGVQITRR